MGTLYSGLGGPAMRVPGEPFRVGRMLVAVAILVAGIGLVALLARPSGMTLARLGCLVVGHTLWGAALLRR